MKPDMYVADGDFIQDIEVNDLRNRYLLTKGSTQEMVNAPQSICSAGFVSLTLATLQLKSSSSRSCGVTAVPLPPFLLSLTSYSLRFETILALVRNNPCYTKF